MLRLLIPGNGSRERFYIADVVFRQFLGVDVEVCHHNREEVVVTDGSQSRLVLDDSFFARLDEPFLRQDKVPLLPLCRWAVAESGLDVTLAGTDLPVLFGKPLEDGSFIFIQEREIRLGLDILGSAFFMLSRYEELVSPERDEYNRFPAAASLAYKAAFLHRPIVNEYVEILWQCLKRLWSGLVRRPRSFRILLSHDVDQPFLLFRNGHSNLIRTMAGDAFKYKSLLEAMKRPVQWAASQCLGPEYDPGYTFGYIMDLAEKHGLRSAFYFIPSLSAGPPDYRYGIHDRDIQRLMSDIHARGHEIGYHASIDTYQDADLIQKEVALLRWACEQIGVKQALYGSRQHYLRIQVPATLRHLAKAGLVYDTTLGYADHAGFRCGTCWEYPFYDSRERRPAGIVERPLVVMDCSVMDDQYMGLGVGEVALESMVRLAGACRRVSGDFTLLWHNSRLVLPSERRLFERLLARLSGN
jgi:hypothetical protein